MHWGRDYTNMLEGHKDGDGGHNNKLEVHTHGV